MSDERLPVAWFGPDGKKRLIRGTETKMLIGVITRLRHFKDAEALLMRYGNQPGTYRALARELKTRADCWGLPRALAMHVDPDPCACGGAGVYIVGSRTFCRHCIGRARARLQKVQADFDPRKVEADRVFAETHRVRDAARAHHRAVGRRRRGHK